MNDIRAAAIALYDRYTHESMDRRLFMERLTRIAGSAAAAQVLLASIAADPAAAAVVPAEDPRLKTSNGALGIPGVQLDGYVAAPAEAKGKLATVMVIHENRGLNAHIEDVARRVALAGYRAVAPDFLTPLGGTPEDQDKAREMIGTLDLNAAVASGVSALRAWAADAGGNGKVGAVGFCWGGAFVNRLAVAAGDALDAGVSYYGPAPDPGEAAKVEAPLLIQLAGNDARVATTAEPWIAALKAAGKPVEAHVYAGVEHAFNNDTSAERYDAAAATLAWERTIAFFGRHLSA